MAVWCWLKYLRLFFPSVVISRPMNKAEFINQLRSIAEELKPLMRSVSLGALTWDGTSYVKSTATKVPDPYALAWWSKLLTIAALIEAQESPLSPKQIAYLTNDLFGGMGSLTDLSFDPKASGTIATAINERLNQKRHALFASFKG
jgi:hypothetical protein